MERLREKKMILEQDARELKFTDIPVDWSMLTQYIQVKPCNSMFFG